MYWKSLFRNDWNDFNEIDRFLKKVNSVLKYSPKLTNEFPPVNFWANDNDVLLRVEIPGVESDSLDITVKNNTITLKGKRGKLILDENSSYIKQERGSGAFVRTFALPFKINSDKVKAEYKNGILLVGMQKAEEEKQKKIIVSAS
jgi:HSP20 family protein